MSEVPPTPVNANTDAADAGSPDEEVKVLPDGVRFVTSTFRLDVPPRDKEATTADGGKQGRDNEVTFFSCEWRPPLGDDEDEAELRGMVCLVHGYGEYLGPPYYDLARTLARAGLLVFGHDHLGHGRTGGERVQCRVNLHEDYVRPVLEHCQRRRSQQPSQLPLFLFGHSLGGLIALMTGLASPEGLFRGVVLMSPLVVPDPAMASRLNVFLAKTLSYVWPSLQISGVDKDKVTRDKDWVARLKSDPLNWTGGIKIKQGYYGLQALEGLVGRLGQWTLPLLVQQGGRDEVLNAQGAQLLYDTVAAEDKKLSVYEEGQHNLYIELDDVRVPALKEAVAWILERL